MADIEAPDDIWQAWLDQRGEIERLRELLWHHHARLGCGDPECEACAQYDGRDDA